jgi:uncharacterized protein YceH (UPF0502 family)
MPPILDVVEARVLGCLLEKEVTTPDYYPLTLNAVVAACNQKSCRHPVLSLGEMDVARALETLREKRLSSQRHIVGSRVIKYAHEIQTICEFSVQERAILCALLLRGPQTVGELRGASASYHPFANIEEVEHYLQQLAERGDGPFVAKLARVPGQKEQRWSHLLCGEVKQDAAAGAAFAPAEPAAVLQVRAENERIAALERQVAALQADVNELKKSLGIEATQDAAR